MQIGKLVSRRFEFLLKRHFLVFFIPVFLTVLTAVSLFSAELEQQQVSDNDLDFIHRETAVSDRIQNQLEQVIGGYYQRDSFLVSAKAYLDRIPMKKPSEKNEQQHSEEMDLPGLPIQPSQVPQEDTNQYMMDKWIFSDKYRVKYIYVSILVDEKTFSSKDIAFVNTVARIRAGLDENRGDIVTVRAIPFPPPVTMSELYKEPVMLPNRKNDTAQSQLPPADPQKTSSIARQLYPYIFYAIGGLIIIMLFFIMLLQIINLLRPKRPPLELPYNPYAGQNMGMPQMQIPQAQNMQMPIPPSQSSRQFESQPDPRASVDSKDIVYELRQLMVTTLVGNPKIAADVFKKWVSNEQDNGIYQIAAFLKATDPRLIDVLAEHLGKEISSKVDFALNQVTSVDKEAIVETLKKFREEFQQMQSADSKRANQEDIFDFLKQLTPEQIFHVIKDEPAGIMAIALAQIPPEMANQVFKELPVEHQAKIPVEIGKLKKIPVSAYRDIADKLSKKALDVKKIKYITTDGVDALGNILGESTPEKEQEMLASITLHDIKLADELRKVYITFEELTKLPDKTMSEILRSFEREEIAKSLIDAPEDIKEKFLNNLPQRMKIMIADEVKSFEESAETPIDEVHKARRIITQKIREMAKSGLIDLKKILG
jgi:flagellar motor switch protein FliG